MFESIAQFVALATERQQPLDQIVRDVEHELLGTPHSEMERRMRLRLDVMRSSAETGTGRPVQSISGISGGSAYTFANWLLNDQPLTGPVLSKAIARAMAVNEVNAGMGCIVATPTAGSAGILPAVLLTLQETHGFNDQALISGLYIASGIGAVIVRRAHVSGAAGGCQAETGSAAAMAAGATVHLMGGSPQQMSHAVAITLKNMLGLVCDPVAGLVEIPCVKRNAAGVAQCFVAADLALAGVESAIPADEVIDAMAQIGARMDERFKETAQGGLAATPTGQRLAKLVWEGETLA